MVGKACEIGIPVTFNKSRMRFRGEKISADYLVFSEKYLKELVDNKPCLFSEKGRALKNYIEIATLKPEFDRNNLIKRIKEIYELDYVDYEKENEYIDSFIEKNSIATNKEEFNEFLNHLQLLKLKDENFCLPQKYVDYIIQQTLETESIISRNNDYYLHLVECVLQDFGKNDLHKSTGERYEYHIADYVKSSVSKDGNAAGYCKNKKNYIRISRNDVRRFIEQKNLDVLDTIFHENIHAEQYYDFEYPNMDDYYRYIMQKEEILSEYYSGFYEENYELTFIEIEAREKSASKLARYIDALSLSEQSCLRFLNAVGEDISKECARVVEREKSRYDDGKVKNISGKKQSVIEAFDNIIKQNPNYVGKYHQLGMEYHEDGRKRTLQEILNYAVNFSKSSQADVVSKIVKYGEIMTTETFLDDMELLMAIQPEHETTNELVEDIILENVCDQIWLSYGKLDKLDYIQLSEYRYILEKIIERSNQNDDGFSRGMKKGYNDSGETMLDDIRILKERIDSILEKATKEDEVGLESIRFLRSASIGITTEELYAMENEFVERETTERKIKQQSREERRQKRKQKEHKKNNEINI